jgi:hypothetical protein
MHGTITPLPQYTFVAWYSVKAQGELYRSLTFTFPDLFLFVNFWTEDEFSVLQIHHSDLL